MTEALSIECMFNTENILYQAYMPFVKSGGLFIKTKTIYELGAKLNLHVHLYDGVDSIEVAGKIVWITPNGAQGNKPAGIGLQFIGNGKEHAKSIIETLLTGKLQLTQATDTM